MTHFPGGIYMPNGKRVDRKGRDLTTAQVRAFPHRMVVSRPRPLTVMGEDIGIEVGRVWVLDDDAGFEALPSQVVDDAVDHIYGGAPLLLLGHQVGAVREVREMMLACILIATSQVHRSASQEASP